MEMQPLYFRDISDISVLLRVFWNHHLFRESMKKYVQDRKEHTLSQMFEVNENLIDRVLQRKLQKDLGHLFNLKQLLM